MPQPVHHQPGKTLEGVGDGVGVPQVGPPRPDPALRQVGAVQLPGQGGHAPLDMGENVLARPRFLQRRGQPPLPEPIPALRQLVGVLPQPGQQAPVRAAAQGYDAPVEEEVEIRSQQG